MSSAPENRGQDLARVFKDKGEKRHLYAFVLGLFSSPASPVFTFAPETASQDACEQIAQLVCTLSDGYASPYLCDPGLVEEELQDIVSGSFVQDTGRKWISNQGVEQIADQVADLAERPMPTY